jgi:uncharacterized protein YbjQ (UPF0145 family)
METWGALINGAVLLGLLLLGYICGSLAEKRHYRSIAQRELACLELPAVSFRSVDVPDQRIRSAQMVYGNAVISIDYFKRFLAGLRNIFGGTVKSYEYLIDRARREAVLRMKEMAGDASVIVNVRIETANIGMTAGKKGMGSVEAYAYGTALKVAE